MKNLIVNISEFQNGEIIAAYTAAFSDVPGAIIGQSGNARLLQSGNTLIVVSRPRIDGLLPECNAPVVDLNWMFN